MTAPVGIDSPSVAVVGGESGLDALVGVEVATPRNPFDRLAGHNGAPSCRYAIARGRAEFVVEPGPAHGVRAGSASRLFHLIEDAVVDTGHPPYFFVGRATGLLSDDGAVELDQSLFIDPPNVQDLLARDDYLDVRREIWCPTSWSRWIGASIRGAGCCAALPVSRPRIGG